MRLVVIAVRVAALIVVVAACIRLTWISDDALITLRTALNVVHGWGGGYNATEAVQAYTHPAWFLLWIALATATDAWVTAILIASVALAGTAAALVLWRAQTITRIIVTALLLVLSNAFVEYSTSGLENPLGFAALGTLFVLAERVLAHTTRREVSLSLLLGLVTALALLTRLDYALLVLPALGYTAWHLRRRASSQLALAIGVFTPLLVWFAWSWATYRAVLPNTLEAKTNVEIPRLELINRGLDYVAASSVSDWATVVGIIAGLVLAMAFGGGYLRSWAWGVMAYLAYVVLIGGDFMAFRFMAVPLYVSVMIIAAVPLPEYSRTLRWAGTALAAAAGVAMLIVAPPSAVVPADSPRWDLLDRAAVADERGYTIGPVGLSPALIQGQAQAWPDGPLPGRIPATVLAQCGGLGGTGMANGPTTHVIDTCGLADRFVARLPFPYKPAGDWRIGHFERDLPDGYLEAVRANDPGLVTDPRQRAALIELWTAIRR